MYDTDQAILIQYQSDFARYEHFAKCVETVISVLLQEKGIKPHSITSRTKSVASLAGKLNRRGKHYELIGDVTDLVGVRIITYLTTDVDRVGRIIDSEFEIDLANSVDKRLSFDPNTFGYLSLHKVCSLSKARILLTEYSRFSGLKCEIQIRTILQHAWAEIEHDIGYKSLVEIPEHMRRSFARVAALLEMADDEFARLSTGLEDYTREVKEEVTTGQFTKPLDAISLHVYVENSALYKEIEQAVGPAPSRELRDDANLGIRLNMLRYAGVRDLGSLNSLLAKYKDSIIRVAKVRKTSSRMQTLRILVQCLVAQSGTDEEAAFQIAKAMYFASVDREGGPDTIPQKEIRFAQNIRSILRSEAAQHTADFEAPSRASGTINPQQSEGNPHDRG